MLEVSEGELEEAWASGIYLVHLRSFKNAFYHLACCSHLMILRFQVFLEPAKVH